MAQNGPDHLAFRFASLATALLILAAPRPCPALQTPAQIQELDEFRHALDQASTAEDVERLASAQVTPSSKDHSEIGRLRDGFAALRLGVLAGDRSQFDRALADFWRVAVSRSSWPYAWYGLGATKVIMGQRKLLVRAAPHQPAGVSYARQAAVALRRALALNPGFAPAATRLGEAFTSSTDRGDPEQSLITLQRLESEAGNDPKAVLALGRLQREFVAADTSIGTFRRYLRVGGDSGIGLLEIATSLLAAGATAEGIETYFDGAAHSASAEATAWLRNNVAWLADSAMLAAFDRTPLSGRRAWLEEFWERRDVEDARRPGERLAEHFRRLGYAQRHFAIDPNLPHNATAQRFSAGRSRLDDRGVVYIRQGEPASRVDYSSPFLNNEIVAPMGPVDPATGKVPWRPDERAPDIPPNTSWKYVRPGGDLIFHFVGRDQGGYRLIESLLDVFPLDSVIALNFRKDTLYGEYAGPEYESTQFARGLIQSRASLDPVYARLSAASDFHGSGALVRERQYGERSIAVGTRTDRFAQTFETNLQPVIQAAGISRSTGSGVLIVFGLPAALAGHIPFENGTIEYAFQFRIIITTQDGRRVFQSDTIRRFKTGHPLANDQYLGGFFEFPSPPGTYAVRVLVSDRIRSSGGLGESDTVSVPVTSGAGLTMSDLILGQGGGGELVWAGPEGSVTLNPLNAFGRNSTMRLYYQLAGLTAGATYRTRVEVRPAGKKGTTRGVAFEFEDVARAATRWEDREVSLRRLKPGDYRLSLTVSGPEGAITRSRRLAIVKR